MNIDKIYNEVIEKLQTEFGWSSLEQLSGMHEELVQDVIKAINLVKNNGVLDDVISCKNCGSDKTKLIVEKRILCNDCVCSYYL